MTLALKGIIDLFGAKDCTPVSSTLLKGIRVLGSTEALHLAQFIVKVDHAIVFCRKSTKTYRYWTQCMWPGRPSGGKVKTSALKHLQGLVLPIKCWEFSFGGLTGSPLLSKPRESLRKWVLCVRACSLHSAPPLFKWPLFKTLQMRWFSEWFTWLLLPVLLKILSYVWNNFFFFFCLKRKYLKNKTFPFVKKQLFLPLYLLMGLQSPFNYKII